MEANNGEINWTADYIDHVAHNRNFHEDLIREIVLTFWGSVYFLRRHYL